MIEVNLVAVLVASIVMVAVGTIWYAPGVFGKTWMRAVGITDEDTEREKKVVWKRFLAGFIATFITLYVLAHFLVLADMFDDGNAITAAFWMTVLVGSIAAHAVIWEKRPLSYYFINIGYTALVLIGGGSIIMYWPW